MNNENLKYNYTRLTSSNHNNHNYKQESLMEIVKHNYDFVIYKLDNLFVTNNKHIFNSDCDGISNIQVVFSHYIPLIKTIELRQFSRNKKNIKKINYQIIDDYTIKLLIKNPINVAYFNYNNCLYFN